jgi:hypothetical protein
VISPIASNLAGVSRWKCSKSDNPVTERSMQVKFVYCDLRIYWRSAVIFYRPFDKVIKNGKISAEGSRGGRCRKGERRPAAWRGAGDASKMGSLAAPQGVYAAFRLLPVPEDSGLPSLFALALAANSCFTLRAIASVSTL